MWTGKDKDRIKWDKYLEADFFVGDGSQLTNIPPGAEVDPTFQAASAAITASLAVVDPHIADGTIHFTSNAIHASLALLDPHIADATIHYVNPGFLTAETDPIFNAASAAYNLTTTEFQTASGALNTITSSYAAHVLDNTIHFTSDALWASLSLVNSEYQTTSAALLTNNASLAVVTAEYGITSAAYLLTAASLGIVSAEYTTTSGAVFTSVASLATTTTNLGTTIASLATTTTNLGTTIASLATTTTNLGTTISSYSAHAADSTDPHGAILTQANIDNSGIASLAVVRGTSTASFACLKVTADYTASGAELCRNILIGTEASTALTASNYMQGTIYLKYT